MTPAVAANIFRRLDMKRAEAAALFGRKERVVYYWLSPDGDGPPEHIALALVELDCGRLARHPNTVRAFVKKCRSRRDGDRYRKG